MIERIPNPVGSEIQVEMRRQTLNIHTNHVPIVTEITFDPVYTGGKKGQTDSSITRLKMVGPTIYVGLKISPHPI